MGNIRVDPTFEALITPLTHQEYDVLEQTLLKDGLRDDIITWKSIIVDGHHRFKICQKHGINIHSKEMEFASETEAKIWMILNQVGRRNLTPSQKAMLFGPTLEALEAVLAKERQGRRTDLELRAKVGTMSKPGKARDIAAKKLGVAHGLITDAKAVKSDAPELEPKVLSGEMGVRAAANIAREEDPKIKADKIKSALSAQGKKEVREAAKAAKEAEKLAKEEKAAQSKDIFDKMPSDPTYQAQVDAQKEKAAQEAKINQEKADKLKAIVTAFIDAQIANGYSLGWIQRAFDAIVHERLPAKLTPGVDTKVKSEHDGLTQIKRVG